MGLKLSGFFNIFSRFRFFAVTALFLFSFIVSAVEQLPMNEKQVNPKESNETLEQTLIEKNIEISNWLDGVAEGLDLFLVGKKLTEEKNQTSIKLENSSYTRESENFKNTTNINVNLRLPNLEEYWQLKFTSYDEKEESRNVQSGYLRQTPRERNYGATIGLFRKLGNVRTSFQPRIGLQDPLKVSHSLRFESVAEVKDYKINPRLEFYADPDKGTGIYWSLNFGFTLSPAYSLTLINEANYEDKTHLYAANNGFSFGHSLSDTKAIAYNLIFNSNNLPSYHLDSYTVSVAYSQLVFKKILDIQIIPHVDFPKAENFRKNVGLVFNLNLNF
jgi:hypothetical protein